MFGDVLATCVLPWDERYCLDEDAFTGHLRLIAAEMTRDVYLFGTAGEGYAVTDIQFREIAALFVRESRECGIRPMLGLVSTSLGTVIDRIEFALELGCERFQLSFPGWGSVADAERDRFFAETCGRFPNANFLHYNTPRSGRVLAGAEYTALAERHPNLVALKFSSRDPAVVRELVTGSGTVRCYFTEHAFALARPYGDCGLLVSLSGIRTDLPREYLTARRRRFAELAEAFTHVHELLLDCVPNAHMDGAFEKVIARAHGARLDLRLLPPYLGATEEQAGRFVTELAGITGLDA